MRAAATQVGVQLVTNLLIRWVRMAPEQCGCRHDHTVAAVAALSCLFFQESPLHWMELFGRTQTLQGGDLGTGDLRNRKHARPDGIGTPEHHTGSALLQPTAKEWAVKLQLIAEHI